jgi:hypothetical protein
MMVSRFELQLLSDAAETITSDTSLAPFGRDDMSKMLDVVGHLEGSVMHSPSPFNADHSL